MQNDEEKRRLPRWVKRVLVTYTTLEGEKVSEQAVTQNISEGGLQLVLVHQLEIGELIDTKIELVHDSIPIFATCKVSYVKYQDGTHQTGLQFVKIEDFQRERLGRYLIRYKE